MLGGDDDAGHSGIFKCFAPLIGVEILGVKHFGVFAAITPFFCGERIGAKVDERVNLVLVPGELAGARDGSDGLDVLAGHGGEAQQLAEHRWILAGFLGAARGRSADLSARGSGLGPERHEFFELALGATGLNKGWTAV